MERQAVSRVLAIADGGSFSPGSLAREISGVVEALAGKLSLRGVVPGHIKAIVEDERGEYAMFNCTRHGDTRATLSPGWEAAPPVKPVLRLSVTVVGLPDGEAEAAVREALSASALRFVK